MRNDKSSLNKADKEKKDLKVSVIIPAKNEGKSIGEVIDGVEPFVDEILVVDGKSKDNTRQIAEEKGVRIIIDNGKGKGAAMRLGIMEVTGDITVFIDADRSHDPKDIPKIIEPIINGEADLVIGSRMRGGSDELHSNISEFIRLIGSEIITLAINYRYGLRLTDSQNGFRAIRTDVVRDLNLKSDITTIEQEMLMKCAKKNIPVSEVPAHEYRRMYGDSKINVWKHGLSYVWSLLKGLV